MKRALFALLTAAMMTLAACGTDSADSGSTDTDQSGSSPSAQDGGGAYGGDGSAAEGSDGMAVELALAQASSGEVLVGADGMTVYMFDPDKQGASTCYDACATNWPPLTVEVTAGEGVEASLLGTVERTDGTMQATYDGWPLYYFAADKAPGDVTGQGVKGVWWVLGADGVPIRS